MHALTEVQAIELFHVAFLDLYDTEAAWEQMQTFVAEKLEEAR